MKLGQRFWGKVEIQTLEGCWQWRAGKSKGGYGMFAVKRVMTYSHRLAYESLRGAVPTGLELDHLCRNRGCVNPDHLEAVTHRANVLRGESVGANNAKATHCPRGHSYSDENTYRYSYPQQKTIRMCKICQRAKVAARKRRNTPEEVKYA